MAYRLRYDREFMRQLKALPGDVKSVVRQEVRELAEQPHSPRAKELEDHPGYYRSTGAG